MIEVEVTLGMNGKVRRKKKISIDDQI